MSTKKVDKLEPSEEHELDVERLRVCAIEYVYARYELRGATVGTMLDAICRVDAAWHELTIAVGTHDPECADCYYVGRDYESESGRPIQTEKGL